MELEVFKLQVRKTKFERSSLQKKSLIIDDLLKPLNEGGCKRRRLRTLLSRFNNWIALTLCE